MDPGAGRSQHSSPFYCSLQNTALPFQLIFLLISKAKPAVLVAAVKWLENMKDIAHHQPLTALSLILIFIQDSEELTNLKSYFLSCMEWSLAQGSRNPNQVFVKKGREDCFHLAMDNSSSRRLCNC